MSAEFLKTLVEGKNLTTKETQAFLNSVMKGSVSPALTAAILIALRMKGETSDEIVGFVRAMRENMEHVSAPGAMDIVGTGGDGSGTFNISTASAFVVAGAGVKVAKHGNRAASSKCGSADVLEALGVNIKLSKEQAEEVFRKVGMVFMLAPLFHPATKEVVGVRKELKIRTIFNVLGPLANPASTPRQLIGVPSEKIAKTLAAVAKKLNYKRLLIIASDGMDEVSTFGKTSGYEVRGTSMRKVTIDPKKLGFKKARKKDILGGGAHVNADIVRSILDGEKGPRRDIVVLNSACALYVSGNAKTVKDGIALAVHSLDSGNAKKVLEKLVRETSLFSN
jgi:anthranilate phosphoribosyltransferase